MSYQVWIYKFVDGAADPVPVDKDKVREVLAPYDAGVQGLTVDEDGNLQFWVRAADGSSADVTTDEYCVSFDRPTRGESGSVTGVFGIVAEVVNRLGAVILDLSAGRALCREEELTHLPSDMREDAVVIEMTGEHVEAALVGSSR
ncbi:MULTISPECIES: hypothetical protein [unclassified Streptomyces]|uniref:hypothetical protein n=1 Tax=unclassified Streptomyces TaxID=2593676 RepID=UPI003D7364FE